MSRVVSILLLILLLGCSREELAPTSPTNDYYPMSIGMYWIYQVNETTYSLLGEKSASYELREVATDSILSDEGITYLITQYTRPDSTFSWLKDSIYSVRVTDKFVVVTENNIGYARLTFPISLNATWDGNAFNALSSQEYEFQKVDSTLNSMVFDEMVKVELSSIPRNLVNQDQRFQIYARGVGLIEKNYIRLNFATSGDDLGSIESGRILKQYLKKYGQD